jgi:hypothetical protein
MRPKPSHFLKDSNFLPPPTRGCFTVEDFHSSLFDRLNWFVAEKNSTGYFFEVRILKEDLFRVGPGNQKAHFSVKDAELKEVAS